MEVLNQKCRLRVSYPSPKPKPNATLWLIANAIHYIITNHNKVTAEDYVDYMFQYGNEV
jgi:hypothetical protein